jgi:hypothetical protein
MFMRACSAHARAGIVPTRGRSDVRTFGRSGNYGREALVYQGEN